MKLRAFVFMLAFAEVFSQSFASFADSRDGKIYKIVGIGTQAWMAENLNYEAEGSKCYDNKPENCAKYGRLYNWAAALKVCPSGWHLPSNEEWNILINYVDGTGGSSLRDSQTAGRYLMTTLTTGV